MNDTAQSIAEVNGLSNSANIGAKIVINLAMKLLKEI
jgi:hypothetical protein